MRKKISGILILCLLLTCFPAGFSFAETETAASAVKSESLISLHVKGERDYSAGREVLNALNQFREKRGLAPLQLRRDLNDAAMVRAEENCIVQSEARPDGTKNTSVLEGL